MNVDIKALEEFNLLAREGAEEATEALSTMTNVDAAIDVAKITVVDRRDIVRDLEDGTYEGVKFRIDGELSGTVLVTFSQESSTALTDSLVPSSADESLARSSLEELANVMVGGFMAGWGDYLETGLGMSPRRTSNPPHPKRSTSTRPAPRPRACSCSGATSPGTTGSLASTSTSRPIRGRSRAFSAASTTPVMGRSSLWTSCRCSVTSRRKVRSEPPSTPRR
ncbi:chemotaxis protein CheC [Haloarculaceae archaeon H-GB2-1]|nr:chemotaxis protein CheC [Haloarculaceae archaeon H-GB11]MEA5407613.1 chemotaxis protein CheC [Haloarculaceae archaeon H-GB2-1]